MITACLRIKISQELELCRRYWLVCGGFGFQWVSVDLVWQWLFLPWLCSYNKYSGAFTWHLTALPQTKAISWLPSWCIFNMTWQYMTHVQPWHDWSMHMAHSYWGFSRASAMMGLSMCLVSEWNRAETRVVSLVMSHHCIRFERERTWFEHNIWHDTLTPLQKVTLISSGYQRCNIRYMSCTIRTFVLSFSIHIEHVLLHCSASVLYLLYIRSILSVCVIVTPGFNMWTFCGRWCFVYAGCDWWGWPGLGELSVESHKFHLQICSPTEDVGGQSSRKTAETEMTWAMSARPRVAFNFNPRAGCIQSEYRLKYEWLKMSWSTSQHCAWHEALGNGRLKLCRGRRLWAAGCGARLCRSLRAVPRKGVQQTSTKLYLNLFHGFKFYWRLFRSPRRAS